MNRFEILNSINANEHVEKKNGLSYLSWAWAWQIFKITFPDSYYTVYDDPRSGNNYFSDGNTCWVKTGVTLVDGDFKQELIEQLPIMDFKNKSIPVSNITSMDVNKAIQRSLTKACARHGLGLYIYSGEDLPTESEDVKELISKVDTVIKLKTSSMSVDDKKAFAMNIIIPIIGTANYKTCKDPVLLQALYDKINEN